MSALKHVINPPSSVWDEICEKTAEHAGWAVSSDDINVWNKAFGDQFQCEVYVDPATYEPAQANSPPVTAIGMFFTHPDYRGEGVGSRLFEQCLSSAAIPHNQTLIGVEAMAAKYSSRHGFDKETPFLWHCYVNSHSDLNPSRLKNYSEELNINILTYSEVPFETINDYDKTICLDIKRTKYLKEALDESRSASFVAVDSGGKVVGLIRGRHCCRDQMYVGPFYVNSNTIAESLLKALFEQFPSYMPHITQAVILVPSSNDNFKPLWDKLTNGKTKFAGTMHGQFTKKVLSVPTEKVYGIFEYVISYV